MSSIRSLYKTKDPYRRKLNVAATLWVLIYLLLMLFFFGFNTVVKEHPVRKVGYPVDNVQRTLSPSKWEWA